jgi:antitoxin CptB
MDSDADGPGLRGRLRWRCRRGMHELDLLLQRWMEREFEGAGAGRRRAFARLLELPDPELAWLLLAGGRSGDPDLEGLLEAVRTSPAPRRPIPGAP